MKSLSDFIKLFKYNKYNDYLLNYSYEDFLENPVDVFGNKIIYENIINNKNNNKKDNNDIYRYLELVYEGFFQGYYCDMYDKYQYLLYESLSPRISEDMSDKVYNEANGIVYHICPNYVVNKILENGLRPKGGKNSKIYKNRVWHPKSIYVIFDKVDDDIKNYFKEEIENDKITNEYDNNVLTDNDVTILKIDLNKYGRKLKFYKDTLGGKSFVYTKEYIPPQCISIYKENKIKKFFKEIIK